MASSHSNTNLDETKQTAKPASYLPDCLDEFQKRINKGRLPSPPRIDNEQNRQEQGYYVLDEIKQIFQLIKENGYQGDFGFEIKFGDLIPIYGTDRIEKLIEILAIARKNGYVNYKLNDFLRQDRDEDVAIRIIKKII